MHVQAARARTWAFWIQVVQGQLEDRAHGEELLCNGNDSIVARLHSLLKHNIKTACCDVDMVLGSCVHVGIIHICMYALDNDGCTCCPICEFSNQWALLTLDRSQYTLCISPWHVCLHTATPRRRVMVSSRDLGLNAYPCGEPRHLNAAAAGLWHSAIPAFRV